jgi:hypothetical protein
LFNLGFIVEKESRNIKRRCRNKIEQNEKAKIIKPQIKIET